MQPETCRSNYVLFGLVINISNEGSAVKLCPRLWNQRGSRTVPDGVEEKALIQAVGKVSAKWIKRVWRGIDREGMKQPEGCGEF